MLPTPSVPASGPAASALAPGFDPRSVPVLAVDSHLPAVPASAQTPEALRHRFAAPPLWSPEIEREPLLSARAPAGRGPAGRGPADRGPAEAAVLIAIVQREQPMVLLTERTRHLSSHSGQVAFPGGKRDPEDADAVATALREAQEEVGLDPALVEVLGSLPPYVTTTGFVVTPVVGLVAAEARYQPNPYEVADLFEVPLAFLLDPANHQRHALDRPEGRREWLSMPYQDGPLQRYIWGATAGMLRNFYRFMQA